MFSDIEPQLELGKSHITFFSISSRSERQLDIWKEFAKVHSENITSIIIINIIIVSIIIFSRCRQYDGIESQTKNL